MTLCVLNNCGSWFYYSELFKFNSVTSERMITKMMHVSSNPIYEYMVVKLKSEMSMGDLLESREQFSCFILALHATDVIFNQERRPVGSVRQARPYFIAKNELHCFKTEM